MNSKTEGNPARMAILKTPRIGAGNRLARTTTEENKFLAIMRDRRESGPSVSTPGAAPR